MSMGSRTEQSRRNNVGTAGVTDALPMKLTCDRALGLGILTRPRGLITVLRRRGETR